MISILSKKLYLFSFLFFLANYAQAQSLCVRLFDTYKGDTDSIKMIPDDFIKTFGQLSLSQKQYGKKLAHYYNTPIFRGEVAEGHLNLDVVISFFIKPKAAFTGNGVTVSNAGIRKAFEKYNSRFSNMDEFFKYLKAHRTSSSDDNHWQSLMASWSTAEAIARKFSAPYHMANFEIEPGSGYGISLESFQPKTGLDSARISTEYKYQNIFEFEKEISLVGGVDPEMIQKGEFRNFTKSSIGDSFAVPKDGLVYNVKRISFDKLQITESNSNKIKTYNVLIKPDGSYDIYAD